MSDLSFAATMIAMFSVVGVAIWCQRPRTPRCDHAELERKLTEVTQQIGRLLGDNNRRAE